MTHILRMPHVGNIEKGIQNYDNLSQYLHCNSGFISGSRWGSPPAASSSRHRCNTVCDYYPLTTTPTSIPDHHSHSHYSLADRHSILEVTTNTATANTTNTTSVPTAVLLYLPGTRTPLACPRTISLSTSAYHTFNGIIRPSRLITDL
ncbi:hypothetical protein E2C01_017199 [Portunus trituberculatus]|uniref:Uncharacterized protein n=1 Tax=Portunus trituberculatus TaxID=210409 RepID=A0A5B7DSJ1_PORTR|nr:hypothetical protein [Portunus trituberculatus]